MKNAALLVLILAGIFAAVASAQGNGNGNGMGPQAGVHEAGTGLVDPELKEEAQGTGQGLTDVEGMDTDAGSEVVAFDLTGDWGSDGANFYIRQVNDTIWWFAEDSAEEPAWTSVARGTIEENTVSVTWVDVPKANATIMGTAVLNVTTEDELQLINQTGGFGGEDWEQIKIIRINSGF